MIDKWKVPNGITNRNLEINITVLFFGGLVSAFLEQLFDDDLCVY